MIYKNSIHKLLHILSFLQFRYNINAEKYTNYKCPTQSRNKTSLAPLNTH